MYMNSVHVVWHASYILSEGKGLHLGITHHISGSFRSIGLFYSLCIILLCHSMNDGMLTHYSYST